MYKSQRWNDGDSFHVILLDQKELIFRLYFVDAPEEERVYADRIVEQAAYFGISTGRWLLLTANCGPFGVHFPKQTKRALLSPPILPETV